MTIHHAQARKPHLGYPVGIAFQRGLFRGQGPDGPKGEKADGEELLDAADIYASSHHLVWRDLATDIQAALDRNYGPDAYNLLLQVGRVGKPPPPNSHFEKLVAETPPPAEYRTPEEIIKYRLSVSGRYGAAWCALHNAGIFAKLVVDQIVIDGQEPSWIRWPPQAGSEQELDQTAFVAGLKAIADEFDLFRIRRERAHRGRRDDAAD